MTRCLNIVSLIAIIIFSSCNREDDLIPIARISFKDAYTAEFTSVSLSCEVNSNVTIETLHVEYSTSKDMTDSKQVEMSMINDKTYSAAIPNLSIQTEYYYRFIVGNKVSEYFDNEYSEYLNYANEVECWVDYYMEFDAEYEYYWDEICEAVKKHQITEVEAKEKTNWLFNEGSIMYV